MPEFYTDMPVIEMGLQRTCSTCKAKPGVACVMKKRRDTSMHIPRQINGVDSYNLWRYKPGGSYDIEHRHLNTTNEKASTNS